MTEGRGLSGSARAVLAELIACREATRRQLCEKASLSKPTVSLALAELDAAQLIGFIRRTQGPVGRSADVYGLSPTAGWILGLDVGSTHVSGRAYALDGTVLDGFRHQTSESGHPSAALQGSVAAIRAFIGRVTSGRGGLRAAGVAVPTVVPMDPSAYAPRSSPVGATLSPQSVSTALGLAEDTPVLLENNVNCSAVAELHVGAGRGRDSLACLQVGVKVGLGIIVSGHLVRGFERCRRRSRPGPVSMATGRPNQAWGSRRVPRFGGAAAPRRTCVERHAAPQRRGRAVRRCGRRQRRC